ncbi:HEAT repeat domain-containing protein [Halapricum salinum]|uniref:HEAT repeat domain-containing protein n=1 Tax=Halapricum salinum TaxID=1457250 RepID=A0A4D6HBN8_9EURY|nr:HEAT repeat domain-containing protein [Halapricum salinum]QCC51413.1 HEAT repeat domain-containing protein [Halapricum salinum]
MLIFAFDRDWTVDVNPHPHHEAVPLEWVRHLAHETDHAVYAIGNQELTEEAAIPGVVDIVGRHPDHWDEWLGSKQPDGYYEQFPLRRERLSLIADLHPDADGYIVIDDLDLSDVEGWQHYHAWDFVPAVRQGDIDPDLPWAGEPVADGGMPTIAGIIPSGADHLRRFLREQDRTPAFEITSLDDGVERTWLCWDVEPLLGSYGRAVAPQLRCTPLDPAAESFSVAADSVEKLSVVRPSPDQFLAPAETQAEEAIALARLAAVNPDAVPVSAILTLLDQPDEDAARDRDALTALQRVAATRPDECLPAIPILKSILTSDSEHGTAAALATLGHIGEEDAADIAPLADSIAPYLDAEDETIRREAAHCIAAIAAEYPDDVAETQMELVEIVRDGGAALGHAVDALVQISEEFPLALEPAVLPLGEVLRDSSVATRVRIQATLAFRNLATEKLTLAVDVMDDVAAVFDADDYRLRNNALALTFDFAEYQADLVKPYVDDIAAFLTEDDAYTRTNASGTLARVAGDFPDAVAHLTPTVIDCLSDDDHRVRENACWALGYLQASEAEAALKDRLDDPADDVRDKAAWALSEIHPL